MKEITMKKLALPISLLVVLALFTMACDLGGLLGGSQQPTAAVPPSGEEPTATIVPSGGEPVATQAPTSEETGEEGFSYTSIAELDWLNSYRTSFQMSWETLDEPTEGGSMEWMSEAVKDPPAQHFVMSSTGTGEGDIGSIEYIQIGDQAWMRMGTEGEGGWMQTSTDESESAFGEGFFDFAGEDFLEGIEGARRVLPDETVNGVLCRHYAFDETSMFMGTDVWGNVSQANGEVWISADQAFTVKFSLDAEGEGLMGTEDRPESFSMVYEIYDINADIVIEPPQDTGLPEDIPLMADAKVELAMEGTVMYSTASSVEDVVAFYQAEMPANGWTEDAESGFSMEGMASLSFTKDERRTDVMVTYDEENQQTSVMLTIQ
jgi:hypothetical protein